MYKTKVITCITQLPEGFTSLKEFGKIYGDSERKKLSDGHLNGDIRGFKLMRTVNDTSGAVYLHNEDVAAYVASRPRRKKKMVKLEQSELELQVLPTEPPEPPEPPQAPAFPELPESEILVELKRIAAAQEQSVELLTKIVAAWKLV
jgi:hypothetical protein